MRAPGIDLKGGVLFAGVGGSRGIFERDFANIAPRLGAAYTLDSKTVFRGGYGLIYAQTFDDPGSAPGFSQCRTVAAIPPPKKPAQVQRMQEPAANARAQASGA